MLDDLHAEGLPQVRYCFLFMTQGNYGLPWDPLEDIPGPVCAQPATFLFIVGTAGCKGSTANEDLG